MTKKRANRRRTEPRAKDETSHAVLQTDGEYWQLRPEQLTEPSRPPAPRTVPALENAISILTYLNARSPETATLAEIAAQLSISRSHCFSLLKTLAMHDWLLFEPTSKSYRLHSGVLRDTSSLLNQSLSMTHVHDILTRTAAALQAPFVLSQPVADDSFIVVAKFSAPSVLEVSLPIGHRIPRNACAEMRAYLAWQSEDRVDQWFKQWKPVKYTERTLVDQRAIRSEISATRQRGYARSMGEFTEGLAALAVPIFNRDGVPILILNSCAPLPILQKREAVVAREMISIARQIHAATGGMPPQQFVRSAGNARALSAE